MADAGPVASSGSLTPGMGMDAGRARRHLEDALLGADDGELYAERSEGEDLLFDDGRLKSTDYAASEGFGLRVVAGEAVGYAFATRMDEASVARAVKAAVQAKAGYTGIAADAPRATNQRLYPDLNPNLDPDFPVRVALLERIDAYARSADPRVVQVSVRLGTQYKRIEILRVDAADIRDVRPLAQMSISVTLEGDGRREGGAAIVGGRFALEEFISLDGWRRQVAEAIRQADVRLRAVPCPAGQMDVVVGPGWNGVLLHEAVGHGLEGDFNRNGTSAFAGRMGERVAAKGVTVFDDGSIDGRRGSLTVDDEGTPGERTILIEDGVLVGYMQDRLNARLMGMAPTGNGRRQSFRHMPFPRMTNTAMLGGNIAQEEMIASTRKGLFCATLGGGQVDITNGKFVFQCTEAYLIEDGRITTPVKGATLIGDGPSALHGVTMVGNDFAFDPGMGMCGKENQTVPVGVGQPSLKISGLTVGGTAVER